MNIIIPKKAFNPKFYPLLREDSHRYLLLYGGACLLYTSPSPRDTR